jgi:hypothetical protein
LLRAEAGQAPLPLSAQDLNLRGKVQLLFAEPFQETVLAHRAELNSMPGVQAKVEQLKTAAVVLTGVSIAVWLALSWFFAGAILRKPQMRYWIACLLGAAILTSLTGWAISESLARFPTEKAQQISGVVLGASAVLLVFMVWGISRSGLVRSTIWCGLAMVSAAVVPPLVVAAALASNVYFYSHALNEAAADKYLSEVWLIPMGVI